MSNDLVGTTWQTNDSGRRFVVISADSRSVLVENLPRPGKRRRILRSALRTSNRKTGYTQIDDIDKGQDVVDEYTDKKE